MELAVRKLSAGEVDQGCVRLHLKLGKLTDRACVPLRSRMRGDHVLVEVGNILEVIAVRGLALGELVHQVEPLGQQLGRSTAALSAS